MKLSKFNTTVLHKEKYIYHNSFTENFLLLEPILMDLINAAGNHNDLENLRVIHEDLYDALVENGFIVSNEVDEIKKVAELIKEIDVSPRLSAYHII